MGFGKSMRRLFGAAVETKGAPAPVVAAPSLANPPPFYFEMFGAVSATSGVSVSASNAESCTAVRCAVAAISEAIGQLPVHVYQRGPDDTKERAPEHPAYALLHDEANDYTSATTLRNAITRDALLNDQGGFAFINRVDGVPFELNRLDPGTVTIDADAFGAPVYKQNGKAFDRRDILHIRPPNGSPVRQCRDAIGLALALEQHAARILGNGARPSGVLEFPAVPALKPEATLAAAETFKSQHSRGNAGGVAPLWGATFKPIQFTSVDAQFMEQRAFAIAEIARAFRVPPVLLQDYGRQTWANAEEGGRQFLTYTLMPWIKLWEGEIALKLFSPDERRTVFAEFLTDDLLRADALPRMQSYSLAVTSRIRTPNEVRALDNLPPLPGGNELVNPNTTSGAVPNPGAPASE